jgi:hypothetical protein
VSPETLELHRTLLRLLKGILSAYERWIRAKEGSPDPHPPNP